MDDDAKLLAEIGARHDEISVRLEENPRTPWIIQAHALECHADRGTLLRMLDEAAAREARLLDSLLRISAAGDMASRMNWEPTMQWALDELAMVKKIARAALAAEVKP